MIIKIIKINYLVHFKAYFHVFSIFLTCRLNTFKNPIRFHPRKIQSTYDEIYAIYLKTTIIDADVLKHEGKGAIFLRQFL